MVLESAVDNGLTGARRASDTKAASRHLPPGSGDVGPDEGAGPAAAAGPTAGAAQRGIRRSYGNSDLFFCYDCSTSSESLCQVRAISIRMDRILKFAARSAIRWHSTACCRHSTGVIIVALMTPHSQTEARPRPNSGPITRPESMCAGRFKISVARRQHSNSWRRRGTGSVQASFSHFFLSARTESK
jgi:hypothetical protein